MKNIIFLLHLPLLIILNNCSFKTPPDKEMKFYSEEDFEKVEKIDAHSHVDTYDTYFIEHSIADNFRLISLNVDAGVPIEKQQEYASHYLENYPDKFAYVTSFEIDNWNDENWEERTINYLRKSFDQGAVGVKVWKNVGMELRDKNGSFVMLDDPRFDAVISFIKENGKTLVGHIGEPLNCWLPIEEMTVRGDREYFSSHPEYHMYLHPEFPSHEEIMEHRDNVLRKHPDLKFVGSHLGSLEWSVDELAKRLDEFPNMAVDMAERISHLQHQAVTDWQKVHDFFIQYQDRLIYGTDFVADESQNPEKFKKHMDEVRLRHWKFFTSEEEMTVPKVDGKFKGMHLPRKVVDKIYRKNAQKWFSVFTNTKP